MMMEVKLKTSTSFRALSISFVITIKHLNLDCRSPTHTTLLNWIHKIGYYNLKKEKERANDWIIIIDESIQIGTDKILMIYGIRQKNIDFTRALIFQDLVPLRESTKSSWNGESIKEILNNLSKEIGRIKYAVCDGGSNIKKGLELAGIEHIYDITHRIAIILRKIYENDDFFVEISKNMAKLRHDCVQTKIAYLIPPKQRTKSRYLNINDTSSWCLNTLKYIQKNNDLDKDEYEKFNWLIRYEDFIKELFEINNAICKIEKILKHNGFSLNTEKICKIILDKIKSEKGLKLKEMMLEYFEEIKSKMIKFKRILLTSDIIESSFGKYKNYISQNPMAGVTNLILCLSAFTSPLTEDEIKKCLENTTINDIKKWTNEIIGKTVFQQRREAYNYE
jgi:hypothetical protein